VKALKKLNLLEKNIQASYGKVSENKNKMKEIKSHVVISTAKILLYKQKMKNLLSIHCILKERLLKYFQLFQNSKKLRSVGKYSQFYQNMNDVNNDIQINNIKFKKRSLVIHDILFMKSKNKILKLHTFIDKQMSRLFIEKKNNYKDLFLYFLHTNIFDVGKYFDILLSKYKSTIFSIIKATMSAFTDDNKSYTIQEMTKLSNFSRLKYEENKFIQAINQLLKNLAIVSMCYQFYYDFHNK
jgi:hypothetical protein